MTSYCKMKTNYRCISKSFAPFLRGSIVVCRHFYTVILSETLYKKGGNVTVLMQKNTI